MGGERIACALLVAGTIGGLSSVADAATAVWDGSISGSWSATSGADSNWTGGAGASGRPAANDGLNFGGSTNLLTTNDFAADTRFAGIIFLSGSGSFTLTGNRIELHANLQNSSTALQTIELDLRLTGNRTVNSTTGTVAISGVISENGAGRKLSKSNGAILILSGANSYTGGTDVLGGTIQLAGADDRLPTAGAVTLQNGGSAAAAGKLNLNGFNQTIASLASSVAGSGASLGSVSNSANGTSTLTITGGATFSGLLTDGGAGKILALTKSTGGVQTLTAASTYTGETRITGGSLLVNGSIASPTVNVHAGTLGGAGMIAGAVTVGNGSGSADAFLSPGTSVETLDTGALTFASDGVYVAELDGLTADRTDVTGAVTLAGSTLATATALDLSILNNAPTEGALYFLINNDGADAVSGLFKNGSTLLAQGDTFDVTFNDTAYRFQISYTGSFGDLTPTGGNDVVLQSVAIPEPASVALLGLGAIGLLRRRRAV